jgi:aspartate/methionine/tyrosine aminotransferase
MTDTGLPDFPWDSLALLKQRASAHPGGLVDLSVGTPVDPTPEVVRQALADASDAPGYPQVWGTADLRQAVVDWFERRRGVPGLDPDGVLPTIGSKELVAWLPPSWGWERATPSCTPRWPIRRMTWGRGSLARRRGRCAV